MKIVYNKNKIHKLRNLILLVFILLGIGLSKSSWADALIVEEKVVLNVSSKAVWALVGGFKALDRWHPDVIESTLIGTGKEKGDIRILTLNNNDTIIERLDFYDESSMLLQYRILESPLPIEKYTATITVKYKEENLTEVVWKSSFDAVSISDDEAKQIIKDIYLTGLQSLNDIFK